MGSWAFGGPLGTSGHLKMYFCFLLLLVAATQGPHISEGSLVPEAAASLNDNNIQDSEVAAVDLDRRKGKKGKKGKKPPKKSGKKPIKKPGKKPGKKSGRKPGKKPGRKPGRKPGKKPGKKPGGSQTQSCECGI